MNMPFGKFKGDPLEDIEDLSYLQWLEKQEWIQPDLAKALQQEIKRRAEYDLTVKQSS